MAFPCEPLVTVAIEEGIVKSITPARVRDGTCALIVVENNATSAVRNV